MKALINTPICPLMLRPSTQCALADEALYGTWVEVLEEVCAGWYLVRTHYRYRGYAQASHLLFGEGNFVRWESLPKQIVSRSFCDVLSSPSVQGFHMETLPRGALLAPIGRPSQDGWQKVCLCDGREGYTKCNFLSPYYNSPPFPQEDALRQAILQSACAYLGTPYRWGGKSPMGIDCSGLTSMAYLFNGILIYRDAQIKEGFPIHAIPLQNMKPADLIFFPGHVALYLGEGRYLHATAYTGCDGVVINSLDPASNDYRDDLASQIVAVGSYFPAQGVSS